MLHQIAGNICCCAAGRSLAQVSFPSSHLSFSISS
jgi:hypothetical protein